MAACAKCGHDERVHMPGSVCGQMHCYCREFVLAPDPPSLSSTGATSSATKGEASNRAC